MNSATGVLIVALPLLAIRYGANPLELGLLGSVSAMAYTFACPFAGWHSERIERDAALLPAEARRRSVMLSCGLLIVVDLCIFLVSGLRDVFILAVSGSLCAAFFWPPIQAWLAEIGDRSRLSERLGMFNLSWSVGIMIGPMIGGVLYAIDYRYPWCYAIATNTLILTALSLAKGWRRRDVHVAVNALNDEEHLEDPGLFFPLALWANFVCWFTLANVQSLYPKVAVANGFSPHLIGCLLFLVGVTQSMFFVLLRLSRVWHYRLGPLAAVHGTAALGMLLISRSASAPLLALAFPLLGVALGLSYYSSIYYSLCGHKHTGRRTSIHEFMVGTGFFLGPAAGGILAQYAGIRSPFLLCTMLLAATALLETAACLKTSRRRKARLG
jgi:predicted MFS family arabinose efflux permease